MTSEYYSVDGTEWKVEIYDNDSSASSDTFTMQEKGVVISDQGKSRDPHFPIVSRHVEIPFFVMASGNPEEDFINDLKTADEDRFFTKIYKATDLEFQGPLVMDDVVIENRPYPYKYSVTAIDGLSRLKDKPFIDTDGSGLYYTNFRVTNYLTKALYQIPLIGEYSGEFLKISCGWKEDQMSSARDPLFQTTMKGGNWVGLTENGDEVPMNCYDVIEGICRQFNARIRYARGKYWFESLNYINGSTAVYHNYEKDGTYIGSSTEDIEINVNKSKDDASLRIHPLAGGKFRFLPPLKRVTIGYQIGLRRNLISGGQWSGIPETFTDVVEGGTIEVADDSILKITGTFLFSFTADQSLPEGYRVGWRMRIKVGSRYLKRDFTGNYDALEYSDPQWSSSNSWFYIYSDPPHGSNANVVTFPLRQFDFEFISPTMVEGGDVEVELEWYSILYSNNVEDVGTPFTNPGDSFEYQIDNLQIELTDPAGTRRKEKEKSCTIQSSANNSKSYEFVVPGADNPNVAEDFNRMRYLSIDGTTSADTTEWDGFLTLGPYPIIELLGRELMALRLEPLRIYSGAFTGGEVDTFWKIQYDSGEFILLRATWETGLNRMSGEWFEYQYTDPSSLTKSETIIVEISQGSGNVVTPTQSYNLGLYLTGTGAVSSGGLGDYYSNNYLSFADGNLPSTTDYTNNEINRILRVFNAGIKLRYPDHFTIDNVNDRISLVGRNIQSTDVFEVFIDTA